MNADVGDLEMQFATAVQKRRDQILDHLLLAVDRDVAAGQLCDLDVLRAALAPEVDAVVHEAFAIQPLAHVERSQQVDGVLLEQAGADAALEVVAGTALDDHRLDARALQQQCEREPGRPGADDANLRAQLLLLLGAEGNGVRSAPSIYAVRIVRVCSYGAQLLVRDPEMSHHD